MTWVAAIPLVPALAFVVLAPLSRALRNRLQWVSVGAMAVALAMALAAFAATLPGGESGEPVWRLTWALATVGGRPLEVGLRLDPLAAVMLVVITVVGTCVQVYSIGYMHRDERRGWYFAVLSLFTAAMLLLVLAGDFLLLYMSWEVMGLCSYLLIGFWHEQPGPREASIKAFLTTRVGDVGFAIGLAVLWAAAGTFSFGVAHEHAAALQGGVATAVALLFFVGAMGKSAQVPLHVWLPDAMAGPTPASALIHAATMVAAGVYLVARALPIFELAAPWALLVVLGVGMVTALVGGMLATVQHDIKKVLAYSTISQLGYMFMALGAGGEVAAVFHLMTHAFFKSLLFLGAGVIIHAAHTQDIREMGGLAKSLPFTAATFGAGALALAGVFPFSGFWSKDDVLTTLWGEGHYVAFAVALLTAGITAFYMARVWFRVFGSSKACSLAREGHAEMVAPMAVLALITLGIGFTGPAFAGFLGEPKGWPDPVMALGSTAVALTGLAAGWWVYGRGAVDTRAAKRRLGYVYGALSAKLYFDLTYEYFIVRPFMRAADALSRFDPAVIDGVVNGAGAGWRSLSESGARFDARVVDGAVNGVARAVVRAGVRARRLQSGNAQTYQRLALAALVLFVAWLFVSVLLKGV